jgi:glyoxylase-like metal-dependent hydrolase (beta-lactamase superfamily II)
LARTAGAPVLAFAAEQPDGRSLHDGEVVRGGGVELRVIHTPGHTPDHLAFEDAASGILFTGDAVLGRGTSVIDPPDGDLTAYLGSLERMETLAPTVLCPGHGPVVWRAGEKIREYLEHRAERDRQVERALEAAGPATAIDLVPAIYTGYPSGIHAAAARSVLAHLLKMEQEGRAVRDGDRFALVAKRGRASAHRGVPVRGVVHPRGAGPAGSSTA